MKEVTTTTGRNGYPCNLKQVELIETVEEFNSIDTSKFEIVLLRQKLGWDLWENKGWTSNLLEINSGNYGNDDSQFYYAVEDFLEAEDMASTLRELQDIDLIRERKELYKEVTELLESCDDDECVIVQDCISCEKIQCKDLVRVEEDGNVFQLAFTNL